MKTIWLDMDGTIADLYGVDGWLDMIKECDTTPYKIAKPLVRMATLARLLNNRQRKGYHIGIVSALAKDSSPAYDIAVMKAKLEWLKHHLPSVRFDEICFVPYSYVKNNVNNREDILFDDEIRHREAWAGTAYDPIDIIEVLRSLC